MAYCDRWSRTLLNAVLTYKRLGFWDQVSGLFNCPYWFRPWYRACSLPEPRLVSILVFFMSVTNTVLQRWAIPYFFNDTDIRDTTAPGYQNNAYCFFLALMLYYRVLIYIFLCAIKIYSITENSKPTILLKLLNMRFW